MAGRAMTAAAGYIAAVMTATWIARDPARRFDRRP
jgi:hypothetical protein